MAAVQNGNGQQVDDGKVDVQQDQEIEGEPIVGFHPDGEHGQNANGPGQIVGPHAGLMGMDERADDHESLVQFFVHVFPRDWSRFLNDVNLRRIRAEHDANLAGPGFGVGRGRDVQGDFIGAALNAHFRRLPAAFVNQINQLFAAGDRHAGKRNDNILCLESGLVRRGVRLHLHHFRMIARVEIQHFEADGIVRRRLKLVRSFLAVVFDDDRQRGGARHRRVYEHVLPGIDFLPVHGLDDISFMNSQFGLRRTGFDVTDDGRIHGHRQADEINDCRDGEGEHHVHERSGKGHENFVQRRRGRHILGRLAFQRLGSDHLRQLHKTAGGNPTQRVFNAVALPTVNLWAETDGEFLDLHAQLPRDPEMAEFVNKNGRAKQHQHGGNNINRGQNNHVKNSPYHGTG